MNFLEEKFKMNDKIDRILDRISEIQRKSYLLYKQN